MVIKGNYMVAKKGWIVQKGGQPSRKQLSLWLEEERKQAHPLMDEPAFVLVDSSRFLD
jgi:hypothetical protein